MKKILLTFLILFFAQPAFSGTTNVEQKIISYIDDHNSEQLLALEKLVNINSGTENVIGVRKIGELMRAELNKLGFNTHWHDLPTRMKHAGSLVAVHQGKSKSRMLLIGHLDTVFFR